VSDERGPKMAKKGQKRPNFDLKCPQNGQKLIFLNLVSNVFIRPLRHHTHQISGSWELWKSEQFEVLYKNWYEN
jgi:hypothetical protein